MRAYIIPDPYFEKLIGLPRWVFFKLTTSWATSTNAHSSILPQVMCFFIHFRHYSVHSLMAHMFNINQSTSHHIITRLRNHFYNYFKPFVNIGTDESRMNDSFMYYNDHITFILDGTEQPIHSTDNIYKEGQYYSSKKKQHSITLLIVISPSGRILYISPCMYGCVNDFELMYRSVYHWYCWFMLIEAGLGDRGFNGLREYGINIYCPITDHTSPIYKAHARKRIKIEMRIADFKDFSILKLPIREHIIADSPLLNEHSKNWMIGGGILNAKLDNWKTIV